MPTIDFNKVKGLLVKAIYSEDYEKDLKKSCTTWLTFRHPNGDKVIVSQKSGYTKYFNPNVTADKGDTIDFLLHRIDGAINTNVSRTGNIDRVAAKIRAIDRAPLIEKESTSTPTAVSKKGATKYTYKTEPFIPKEMPEGVKKLLHKRGINPLLLQSADVAPQLALLQIFRDNVPLTKNLLFRFRDEHGKLVGGQYKYISSTGGTAKMFTPNTPRERALWVTSSIGDKDGIFICEDPIDALSYRQMHPDKNYALIATGGSISEEQVNLIKQVALKFNKPLILGNDNDINGQLTNLNIMRAFLPEKGKNNMEVVSKNNKEQTATLKINGEEQKFTLPQLNAYNLKVAVARSSHAMEVNSWGNIVSIATPKTKDWNEDLQNILQKTENSPVLIEILQRSIHTTEQAAKDQNSHVRSKHNYVGQL